MLSEGLRETWALYSVGSAIILLRIISRARIAGISHWKPDDYLIIISWILYTVMTVAAHIVTYSGGDNAHITDEARKTMSAAEKASRVRGSQWFMVGEFTYNVFIWSLKINLLFFYQRVVNGLWVEKYIKPAIYIVIATGITVVVILSTACHPFHKLWQIYPDPGKYCTPESPIFFVPSLVLNILTDMMIIALPAPVIIPIQTTLARKLSLYVLFGGGIFVMTAAILRVYFVLAIQDGATAAIWSVREDLIAIVVGQAGMIRPFFSSRFWTGHFGTSKGTSNYNSNHAIELSDGKKSGSRLGFGERKPTHQSSATAILSESEENLAEGSSPASSTFNRPEFSEKQKKMNIVVSRRVEVNSSQGDVEAQTKLPYSTHKDSF